jgi:hypothetical protein
VQLSSLKKKNIYWPHQKNTIKYSKTWYGTNYGGFKTMFMDQMYLQLGDAYLEDVK